MVSIIESCLPAQQSSVTQRGLLAIPRKGLSDGPIHPERELSIQTERGIVTKDQAWRLVLKENESTSKGRGGEERWTEKENGRESERPSLSQVVQSQLSPWPPPLLVIRSRPRHACPAASFIIRLHRQQTHCYPRYHSRHHRRRCSGLLPAA